MTKPFGGTINVDVRDSDPDWGPFEPPKAPDSAPNVLYIVLDDVGYSALSCYGGPIETPNIDRIVAAGVRYTQFHTTALCSPTRSCLHSNGDIPMLHYSRGPTGRGLRLLLLHDDPDREFDYTAGAEQSLERANRDGWTVVSIKNDWATVFPEPYTPDP
jgi:hypothetical protein